MICKDFKIRTDIQLNNINVFLFLLSKSRLALIDWIFNFIYLLLTLAMLLLMIAIFCTLEKVLIGGKKLKKKKKTNKNTITFQKFYYCSYFIEMSR